jgi:hypothetical protein
MVGRRRERKEEENVNKERKPHATGVQRSSLRC